MKKRRRKGKTTKQILDKLDEAITVVEDLEGYCFSPVQQERLNDALDAMYNAHARLKKLALLARAAYGKENYRTSIHPCGQAILHAYRVMKGKKTK